MYGDMVNVQRTFFIARLVSKHCNLCSISTESNCWQGNVLYLMNTQRSDTACGKPNETPFGEFHSQIYCPSSLQSEVEGESGRKSHFALYRSRPM